MAWQWLGNVFASAWQWLWQWQGKSLVMSRQRARQWLGNGLAMARHCLVYEITEGEMGACYRRVRGTPRKRYVWCRKVD